MHIREADSKVGGGASFFYYLKCFSLSLQCVMIGIIKHKLYLLIRFTYWNLVRTETQPLILYLDAWFRSKTIWVIALPSQRT